MVTGNRVYRLSRAAHDAAGEPLLVRQRLDRGIRALQAGAIENKQVDAGHQRNPQETHRERAEE